MINQIISEQIYFNVLIKYNLITSDGKINLHVLLKVPNKSLTDVNYNTKNRQFTILLLSSFRLIICIWYCNCVLLNIRISNNIYEDQLKYQFFRDFLLDC